jgi:hypothetical protein
VLRHLLQANDPDEVIVMSSGTILIFGLVAFGLLLIGLVFTMIEFHRMTDRPDRVVGVDSQVQANRPRDLAA